MIHQQHISPVRSPPPQGNILQIAADKGNLEAARHLVESGIDSNTKGCLCHHSALHFATKEGHLKTVKFLIQIGADVNLKDLSS